MGDLLNRALLAAECQVFCRYLLEQNAAADVVAAYQRAHEVGSIETAPRSALDLALLRVARIGPAFTRATDAFAAVAATSSVLRRKLILLIAILESRGPTATAIDTAVPGSRVSWMLAVAWHAGLSVLYACLAALLVAAPCAWYAVVGRREARP